MLFDSFMYVYILILPYLNFFHIYYLLYVCAHTCTCVSTVHLWKSEDNFQELVSSTMWMLGMEFGSSTFTH